MSCGSLGVADTGQRFCMSACWPHVLITVAPSPSLCGPGPAYDIIEFSVQCLNDWDTVVVVHVSRTVMDCTSLRLQCQPHSCLLGSFLHCKSAILFKYQAKPHKTELHASVVHFFPWGFSRHNGKVCVLSPDLNTWFQHFCNVVLYQ